MNVIKVIYLDNSFNAKLVHIYHVRKDIFYTITAIFGSFIIFVKT